MSSSPSIQGISLPRAVYNAAAISPARPRSATSSAATAPVSIFSTAMPPAIAAGALASLRHLKANNEVRIRHQERAATLKRRPAEAWPPVMDSQSHIVLVMVGSIRAVRKRASDELMARHGIYVQPDQLSTVAKGTERLQAHPDARTPTPMTT